MGWLCPPVVIYERAVCQALTIPELPGCVRKEQGGPCLFLLQCACLKQASQPSITVVGSRWWKAELSLLTSPLSGIPSTWQSLKVMPVNHILLQCISDVGAAPRPLLIYMAPLQQGEGLTGSGGGKKTKQNNLQTWSGYLINYDNTVWINEQLLQRASRLWQLRIVAEGNSTSSGVCHRNEQDLCQYFVNKQIWNGSANISPLRWEGSFNEECCVPTIFNRPAFEWQCTAAEHMLCFCLVFFPFLCDLSDVVTCKIACVFFVVFFFSLK